MGSLWRAAIDMSENPTVYNGVEFWSNPERTGWLTKQGEYIKTWRRRWFVLKQDKFFWFKESTVSRASRPRGGVSVANCLTVKGSEDILNKPNAFELSTCSDTMYFIADSEKEKEDWINSIGRSVVQHSRSDSVIVIMITTLPSVDHALCNPLSSFGEFSFFFCCFTMFVYIIMIIITSIADRARFCDKTLFMYLTAIKL